MSICPFAHTLEGHAEKDWQPLVDHLEGVARLAAEFARPFGAAEWGRLAGLWHDLGKFSQAYQEYLREASSSADSHRAEIRGRVDHSTAGAQHAVDKLGIVGHLLAYAISGHHSGLLDGLSEGACLQSRLRKTPDPWQHGLTDLLDTTDPDLPGFVREALAGKEKNAFCIAFFVRMIFSCLVDADFLDTERFMQPEQSRERPVWPKTILEDMGTALQRHVDVLETRAADNPVNRERLKVKQACLDAAPRHPGLFSLTVPTGGGKTLSSLGFALRHAVLHGLDRVIYVVPFTTIIEQNAAVFRKAMETLQNDEIQDPVLEHHSNIDTGEETNKSRLATENWDSPLVVTTSVQFYESLFAKRTSRCRKLHRLARSVIILDEVQTLPVDFLAPCLRALRELVDHYGTTVVLCTATQPAIQWRDEFPIGLREAKEIISQPSSLYRTLRRVELENIGEQSDESLNDLLRNEESFLCIVNTRHHARKLFEALGENEGYFHLSALMCPAHRSEVLAAIRDRLDSSERCGVISTQLIEAGVDIDFPVVYRSLAGLDAIAQAAGRCNRNGLLNRRGRLFVFRSQHTRSELFIRDTANTAEQVLSLYADPLTLEAIERFFKLYYWDQSARWDSKHILDQFHLQQDRNLPFSFSYTTVARDFRLIPDTGKPIIIPWGHEGNKLCDRLRYADGLWERDLLRRLQRYSVQIPERLWVRHIGRSVELAQERFPLLISPEVHYSEQVGLALDSSLATYLEV